MSRSEAARQKLELPKLEALEAAVRRALRQLEIWRERAIASETERRRLEGELEKLGDGMNGGGDPTELLAEVESLREENGELRRRLTEGRRQAEQLIREVEFLEDTR